MDIRAVTSSAVTIFTVYKQGAQSGDQGLWGDDNGDWDRFYFSTWPSFTSVNNGGASLGLGTPNAAVVTNAGVVGVTRLLTAVYNNGVNNGSAIYFDGKTVTTFTDRTDPSAAQADFRIGWDGDDNCYNGDVAEMIVYNRQLTACEIQQVNRYLGGKYGIVFSNVSITGTTGFPAGGSTTLSTAATGTAYQWLFNNAAISGANSGSYIASVPGDYRVAVTNGCIDTSAVTTVTATTMVTPGNALNFNGVNNYVDCGTSASLAATNIRTMECWVKLNTLAGDQEIMSKSITDNGIELLLYGGNLGFFCMNGISNTSYITYPASSLVTGVWYHLAVSWDGSTKESMRMYVNGVPVGTRTDNGNINNTGINNPAGSFKIGQWSQPASNRYFNGSIDEARVWSVQRSQLQIQASMLDIVTPVTGLRAYYKFDLGTNAGNNTTATTVYDVSGNYLPGALTNFILTGSTSNWMESYAMVVPAAAPASTVGSTNFVANWTAPAVGTVTNYVLDVSTNPLFTSFVPGYNGLNAGPGTSYTVAGVQPVTTYYYRTRASKTSVAGQGAYPTTSATVTTLATLPVTLVNFTAKQAGGSVSLLWSTASELNSARFVIERSSNGTDYSRIATTAAAGTSSASLHYNTTDKAPLNGVNYYRLKLEDKDGNFSYSGVQQVVFVAGKAYTILYPSPATDHIVIESNDATLAGTTGMISDMQGRIVKKFIVSGNRHQVDISALTKGVYNVQLGNKQTFRIVKE